MRDEDGLLRVSAELTSLQRLTFAPLLLLAAISFTVGVLSGDPSLLLVGAALAIGGGAHGFRYWQLKDIVVDRDTVHASTFSRTISFPVSAIASIEARKFRPNTAVMRLKQETAFGDCLIFTPGFFSTVRDSPAVAELLARARRAAARAANP
jgi:hypothetical protein